MRRALSRALGTAGAARRGSSKRPLEEAAFGTEGRGGPVGASPPSTSSPATPAASLASALRPLYAAIHPDAVHGHAEAERVNSVAFHELREWSKDVERGGGGGGGRGGVRRLRFFVRRSDDGKEGGAVSAVSAALPSPSAARRSRDPLVLLRPLLVAAGLLERGAGGEDCSFEEEEEEGRQQRRRSAAQPSASSEEDVDDSLLASLRDPAAFFAAALKASRARRAAAAARATSPVVLDASRRRAALKIVRGIAVRYGQGFCSSSSSSSSSSAVSTRPPPAPEEVARQVRRLAETVEDFLGRFEEEEEGGGRSNNPLRGSTIFLVKSKRTTESERLRRSGVDPLSGAVSLDVSESTQSWLEALEEASDPGRGAAARRGAAGRRAEAEALAAAALGVDSVTLLLNGEEESDERTLSVYDALVLELASAAAPASSCQERRHADVVVVISPSSSSPSAAAVGTITVNLKDSPSALSVFNSVESAGPAATAELLELRRAETATRKLLQAAATKLGVSPGELGRDGGELLPLAEAAAAAARILRAPDSSRIAGSARGLKEVFLGRRNTVSRDGERVTLGVDFEV